MFTIISRIFHFGFKNFSRNGWLSTATVAIMTLALIVFGGLILFGYMTQQAAASIENKIDISVYFHTNTSEDQILNIQQSLQGSAGGCERELYFARSGARHIPAKPCERPDHHPGHQRARHQSARGIAQYQSKDPSQYGDIANYSLAESFAIHRYHKLYAKSGRHRASREDRLDREDRRLVVTIFLTIIAGLVIFNTIRIAIYSNRDEIGIMRVVGASNSLVRGPFVVEGMLWGTVSRGGKLYYHHAGALFCFALPQ